MAVAALLARLEEGGWYEQWYRMMRAPAPSMNSADALSVLERRLHEHDVRRSATATSTTCTTPPRSAPVDPTYDWRPAPRRRPTRGNEWHGLPHPRRAAAGAEPDDSGWLQNCNSTPMRGDHRPRTGSRDDFPAYMIGREVHNPRARSATRHARRNVEKLTFDEFAEARASTRGSALADAHASGSCFDA